MNLAPLFLFVFIAGCSWQNPTRVLYSFSGMTMGTTYTVKFTQHPGYSTTEINAQVEKQLKEVNRQMSTYIPDSEISQLNREKADQLFSIGDWFDKTLRTSLRIAAETNGQFDPTIGPLVNLWGFGPNGKQQVPSQKEISQALKFVGYPKLKLVRKNTVIKKHSKVYVDLSASAKGFAVDMLSELLSQKGLKHHLIEVGGEMRAAGLKIDKPWRVAIEKPDENRRAIQKIIELKDVALATSGSYRNFFRSGSKKYSHTIDTSTGQPIQHGLIAVSVIAESCLEADTLATALMAMGPVRGPQYAKQKKLAAYFIMQGLETEKMNIRATAAFTKQVGI